MADIETGKIENDKEKNSIDEMTDDRSKLEDSTLQATAAEIKNDHDLEVVKEWTNENPCGVLSKSEQNKDGTASGRELEQIQPNSGTDQLCTTGESSTELEDIREGQSHNSEIVDKSEGIITEKSEETRIKIVDKTEEPSTEIKNKIKGPRTEAMNKVKEPSTEITEKTQEPSTEIMDKMEEPSTEITDETKGPSTETIDKSEGPSTGTIDKSERPSTGTIDKSEGPSTEMIDKSEGPSTETIDKSEGPSTETIDKSEGPSTGTIDKSKGPSTETICQSEGPSTGTIDKSEGPSTGTIDKSEGPSTEITQTEYNNEITQKSKEHQNIVGINEIIPQSEVTAVEQTQITKDEVLPDQNPCSVETSETKSNEEKTPDKFNNSEIEMMDQSELGHHTSEAEVMMVCENEISKPSENDSNQEKSDNGKETVDVSDPPIDNGNKDSHLVSETFKMSSSDSSLDSKKENFDDTKYANEMDRKSALISSGTIQLPMEVDDESIQSETAMFDTPGPATPASSIVDAGSVSAGPTPSKRSRQNSTGSGANVEAASEDLENHTFPASRVFEYQWPKDSSGEYYMLQEQISEFLGVKSFKRKYPELQRRPVEMNERMFLREKGAVTETQCDLGLTAIRSDEVYDLMHRDYPDKYAEYAAVLHERERQTIKEKHKDYEVPKLEKSKMTEYIQKAMKSASEWNTSFLRERKEERRAYFDLQTFNVHYPAGRFKVLPTELTSPTPYPVTLIPGQYQDYYKSHSTEELKYLPLNTALFNPPKQLGNSLANPQEVLSEDASEEDAEGGAGSDSESDDDSSSGESDDSSEQDSGQVVSDVVVKGGKTEEDLTCRMCEKQGETDEDMVQCSECKKFGHPTCLDLTAEMVTVIKTYPWQCMECKTCVECMDPYDEDKMIFCDRCDRGYHTFCVGLRSIPNGQWKCRSCKSPDTPRTPKSSSKLRLVLEPG
ncbi:PHD finger protein 10 [Mizuhopecten yessoensis]|uniref:PHD finger protein 10 n=1 Tax=Mizuhopecten yessoensis TaxID=6573 RepID=A0A210QFC3_MIZYE|nr:PHD finger protein 10 [Mizuhopecten yessoensis]